jgi:hypothetical protein
MAKMLNIIAIAAFLAAVPVAGADVLIIDKVEEARTEMPPRGMTMELVQSRFGAPQSSSGPVGQPPITRWDYANFVVVFEHRHVIHSIERRARPAPPVS